MGAPRFRCHLFTEGDHVRVSSHHRAGRTGGEDLSDSAGRPPTPTSAASPNCSPQNPIGSSSGRPSSRSATGSTRSGPRPSRPLWTSGKKGLPRVQYDLSALSRSARFVDYRPKTVQSMVGTFPLIGPITTAGRVAGHAPLGRDPRALAQMLTPGAANWSASPARGQLRRGRRRGAQEAGRPAGLGIDRRADQRGGRRRHRPAAGGSKMRWNDGSGRGREPGPRKSRRGRSR